MSLLQPASEGLWIPKQLIWSKVFYGHHLFYQGIDIGVGRSEDPMTSYFHELRLKVV